MSKSKDTNTFLKAAYFAFNRKSQLTDAGVLLQQLTSPYEVYYHKGQANYYIYL
jgi:hypothetical protein